MDATLPFRWRRSPSHGKCSRRFCGSLRNYGRRHHQHQRETLDGHALKSNRREECVLMPAKMSRSAPRPPFRLREVSIAVRTLRLSCRKAGKAPIFTPVRESSGESRLNRSADVADRHSAETILCCVPPELRSVREPASPARWLADPGALRRACEDAVRRLLSLPTDKPSLRCSPTRRPKCWQELCTCWTDLRYSSMRPANFLPVTRDSNCACPIGYPPSSTPHARLSRSAWSSFSGS